MTEPLILRPRAPADLPTLWYWQNHIPNPEWRRWDGPYFEHTIQPLTLAQYTEDVLRRPANPNRQIIDIGGVARGQVSRSWEAPEAGGWMELGIVLYDPAFWSGGYGTRALQLWTGQTFKDIPAHVLTLTTWSGNVRMVRAAQKVGYCECARVREARLWEGRRYDSVKLDLLRREWEGESAMVSS